MNSRWSCLLIVCVLLSGCTLRKVSRTDTSPALASTGSFQTYTYSAPRNSVPIVYRPEARQIPVSHLKPVVFLSPRMQDFYRANRSIEGHPASASKVNVNQPVPPKERGGGEKIIGAQLLASKAFGPISNEQVTAASLFPVVEPHYAGLIAVVIIFAALIYWALYKFAGFVRQAAGTIPLEGSNESTGESQLSSQNSSAGSTPEEAQTSGAIRMQADGAGADKLKGTKSDCSDRRKKILQDMQSRIRRTFKSN